MNKKERTKYIAAALKSYAGMMMGSPDSFSVSAGKELDRAIRCCRGLPRMDRTLMRWASAAKKHGWRTDGEMIIGRYGYEYPDFDDEAA